MTVRLGSPKSDQKPIEEVVETIRKKYRPERIILFGSRVWGGSDSESDLDVLVIKRSRKRELERIREVYRLVGRYQRRPYRLPLDILVKTPAEVNERLANGDDFLRDIMERGKVVYERVAV
jgi:predicted nucleotidyltransferase